MAEDCQIFGITGDWSPATLKPGVWYRTVVREGGCRFMATWVEEEEKAPEHGTRTEEEKSGRGGQG